MQSQPASKHSVGEAPKEADKLRPPGFIHVQVMLAESGARESQSISNVAFEHTNSCLQPAPVTPLPFDGQAATPSAELGVIKGIVGKPGSTTPVPALPTLPAVPSGTDGPPPSSPLRKGRSSSRIDVRPPQPESVTNAITYEHVIAGSVT